MNISIIGLGKLGSPMAAVLASKGHTVIGVDLNEDFVRSINEGRAPVVEPGLDELIQKSHARLSATTDFKAAVANSEVTFIIVPTPSDPQGGFSLRYVMSAIEEIGQALKQKNEFHLVVLTSTVMPGSTGGEVLPALEQHSGKRCGRDFGLCYNPEFIALGSVVHDMLNPDFILIGESDSHSGDILASIHTGACDNTPAFARMNFMNAELTKLAVNTYVTTKISYANMLAQVCEQLPGADVDVVTSALGLDTRIGRKYLKGALGYGGPCFPRDNVAFSHLARQIGANAGLAEATDRVNREQVAWLADIVMGQLPSNGKVGILGLSYKPNTNVIEEAQGLELARQLSSRGVALVLYDPAAMENARASFKGEALFATSMEECTQQSDVVVITTPWDEFKALSPESLNHSNGRPSIVDCWRILPREEYETSVNYVALGRGPQQEDAQLYTTAVAGND
ncbi:MAG: UDP-glucose/GDP-mannose dehydrogenase family protein [Pyrinomonadaceae bacterium]